ncbi:MAG: hypothetical protein JJU45_06975 [Acidimicrobiia bacterium]|nr:hypothetical protein [Acidimicrobiia bacterium]
MFRHRNLAIAVIAAGALLVALTDLSVGAVIMAGLASYVIFALGFAMLGSMARPVPEPAPPGELRKVKLTYRCAICGAEVRMTVAPTQDPEPPRHCLDEMQLVTPVDEI